MCDQVAYDVFMFFFVRESFFGWREETTRQGVFGSEGGGGVLAPELSVVGCP